MAVFALRVVKQAAFEGSFREFGNTYHYRTNPDEPFEDASVANQVAEAERQVTSNAIEFIRWETWGPTDGTEFDNVLRESGALDGFGAIALSVPLMREYGALVTWPLPRSPITNRKRWLRKFLRSAPGGSLTTAQAETGGPLPAANLAALEDYAATVRDITSVGLFTYPLVNDAGEGTTDPGVAREYMTTREIASAH